MLADGNAHVSNDKPSRIVSIDLIRGAVMILMAIDHVRVYSGLPAGGASFGIFFTRWVTHFCAPAFIFLAGSSAFFYGLRHDNLSRFLLTRGIWLVILELTVLRVAWTFNFDFAHYEMAGVLWVIGWCMILMAGLIKLPFKILTSVSIMIIAAHNLMDPYLKSLIPSLGNDIGSALWKILYVGFFAGPISMSSNGPNLIVLYSIVPWIGVMGGGYVFGKILTFEPERRNRWCLTIGLGAVALFLVLRGFNVYGDLRPWGGGSRNPNLPPIPPLLSFLNTTKYPASLSFLLMTLGPTISLIPLLETVRGRFDAIISMFGRVPFLFYLLHIPLIHGIAVIVSVITLGEVSSWLFANHPMGNPPPPSGYIWTLWTLYAVWVATIILLYFICQWFANLKARRTDWWLKYI